MEILVTGSRNSKVLLSVRINPSVGNTVILGEKHNGTLLSFPCSKKEIGKGPDTFSLHFTLDRKPWSIEIEVFIEGRNNSIYKRYASYNDGISGTNVVNTEELQLDIKVSEH